MKIMYLGLFLLIPNISISQVIGNHGGGMDLLGLARVSGLGTKDLLCLMKATKTKKIETDLLESWNRKYETHTDIIDLIDYILIEETIKGLNYFIPVIKSPVFKCENQSEDSTFTLSKRNNAEKELDLLKEMLSAWEQGRDGFEAQNICEEYFAPRVKRLDDLKKVIELYEKKP